MLKQIGTLSRFEIPEALSDFIKQFCFDAVTHNISYIACRTHSSTPNLKQMCCEAQVVNVTGRPKSKRVYAAVQHIRTVQQY